MSVKDTVVEVAQTKAAAHSAAVATTTSGLGTWLEMIPTDIGKLATLVGIVLSAVLTYTTWRKGRIEYELTRLEVDILREKEYERIDAARKRKAEGLACQREADRRRLVS